MFYATKMNMLMFMNDQSIWNLGQIGNYLLETLK